ncbi:DUF1853 family protein [Paraburkholderia sp. BCC1886]|uniref:DUF1853 family protein n=1 Tax=Paraburkholderia sp. BCC1886 TaxID=2562670 RepID=UPI0011827E0D|nr:DUF1853 family protein [Paraburkholderia sp. BCC1886]
MLLTRLRDPAVRDLAWLLLSPDLLCAQPPVGMLARAFETPDQTDAGFAWLTSLDAQPRPLHDYLAATRITRLGRYAERLLGWFLQHGPAARLVAAGVPLRRAGITLGECDFLLEAAHGERLHWELAVKCYLHAGSESGAEAPSLSDYVGPNLKDRFDLKLAHLLNHQLPLSARDEFAALGYQGPWTPQMFIKGWLFYRYGQTPTLPTELDARHGRGWWVTRSEWPDFASAQAAGWKVLPKLEWLAPRRDDSAGHEASGGRYMDAPTLLAQLSPQAGPTLVAAFAAQRDGTWIECSRGFIVPDEWPASAQNYARQ